MKKLILGLSILTSLTTYAFNTAVKIGYTEDVLKVANGADIRVSSPTLAVEFTQGFIFGEIGVGTMYTKGNGTTIPDVFPPYALAKIYTFPVLLKPYIVGKVGYNALNSGIEKFGGYYGVGAGVSITDIEIEALYSNISNKISSERDLGQVTVTVGYKF